MLRFKSDYTNDKISKNSSILRTRLSVYPQIKFHEIFCCFKSILITLYPNRTKNNPIYFCVMFTRRLVNLNKKIKSTVSEHFTLRKKLCKESKTEAQSIPSLTQTWIEKNQKFNKKL